MYVLVLGLILSYANCALSYLESASNVTYSRGDLAILVMLLTILHLNL
jgi:hypothetical protein